MIGTILIILLVLLLVGALPTWSFNTGRGWGYGPSGLFGLLVLVLIVLLITGRI